MDEREQKYRDHEYRSEFAQDITPDVDRSFSDRDEVSNSGTGFGIAGIVFSVLSFFLWPYLMAPIGIILGVIAVSRKSTAGWWAIGIGVIALILVTIFMIFAIPFRILF
ncbi:hypothetical protein SAMN05444392_102178 [Seinonella peptonophila]|uniref:DUF4190 domain-containing protein n=1 Tax=Seinonella peptonophila TaxID=112248 RepID=A0A1M4V5L7_9BACL|nr:hypothetical protein [Seinonella peptonophila]SHE64173.1 hypothetical protein SAMN05444392_102178 [Seinonella peptonophila]